MNRSPALRFRPGCLALVLACGMTAAVPAQTVTLRIATYNIEADTSGDTAPLPGLIAPSGGTVQQGGVLEGLGEEIVGADPAQPIDILALEETTSNTATVSPIVNGLNAFYNAPGMYAMSPYQATESGGDPTTGNGPNALVYNTTTVQLLASVPVDPPGGTSQLGSTSGEYREVMRYEFAPAGVTPTAANEFYVYVSHYKASPGTANEADRAKEAQIIRNDSATLPGNARILYVGDYNPDDGSGEAGYQTIIAAGVNQGIDPMNPSGASGLNWSTNTLMIQKTEATTGLDYRDDLLIMTTNVFYGVAGGLALVPGSCHVFGNNGTTPFGGSVASGNSALTNLAAGAPISAAQLYQDLTTASDHLPVVADFTLSISGPSLAVSPAGGLASTGVTGGPFSPASQSYTLTNTGTASLPWTASNAASWLTVAPASGVLAAGASTNLTVAINANANSLAGGGYADTVSFVNASNGVGSTTRSVSLTVTGTTPQLSVSPASGLTASGPVGGTFSPASQVYGLTNVGGANLNWTATNTANWLTLSSTGGTLAPGVGTNLTVSLNANANSLAAGSYSDTVSFTNLNNGAGNTTRSVSLTINNFGFYDDFGTFSAGNLVGQGTWLQYSNQSATPLQVTGGQVIIPGGQTADTQDAYKNFIQTNSTLFYGLTLTVTSAVNSTSTSYFTALWTSNNAAGYANYRLTAKAGNASQTNFVLGLRISGQSGNPYTFGSTLLSTGVQYRVIVQAPSGYTNSLLYVNPTSADLASQTAYASNPIGGGTAPATLGSFVISQYGTTNIPTDGVSIGKVVVSDSFATVYNDLTATVLTPFQSWQVLYFGSTNNAAAAPTADPDHDGMSNWAEFLAGTNPTNSASVLRITAVTREGDNLRITWTMGGGKTNVLQHAAALGGASSFTDAVTVLTVGSVTNYLDVGAATNAPARYYRVRLGP